MDWAPQLAEEAPSACENDAVEFDEPSYPIASCCICGDKEDAEGGDWDDCDALAACLFPQADEI